jgi:hypothetical protein
MALKSISVVQEREITHKSKFKDFLIVEKV